MSHAAIDNLFAATYEVFAAEGRSGSPSGAATGEQAQVRSASRESRTPTPPLTSRATTTTSSRARPGLWARPGMRPFPVDVLIVDEAGQLALADAVASANAARNLILLGDPLQLAQVSQAEHPDGSGASVLEHILGDHADHLPAPRRLHLRDPAHASRRLRVHLESDLRRSSDEPRLVRSAGDRVRHRPAMDRGPSRRSIDRVCGGSRAGGGEDPRDDRHRRGRTRRGSGGP